MNTQAHAQATRICLLFGLRSRDEEGLGLFWADWKTIILDLKKRKNFALETTLKKIYDSWTEKRKKGKKKDSKNAHKINRDGGKTKKMREGSERRIGRKREMRERERERERRGIDGHLRWKGIETTRRRGFTANKRRYTNMERFYKASEPTDENVTLPPVKMPFWLISVVS